MDTYKLHIKVGEHEFNGEGPEESIKRDFELWKELISIPVKAAPDQPNTSVAFGGAAASISTSQLTDADIDQLSRIFLSDDKRNLVTLRALPRTDNRDSDSMLLILYGYLNMRQQHEVTVTQLKSALRQSGCMVDRVDRVASKARSSGWINKGGLGKGGRYSLTNAGIDAAKAKVQTMLTA